MEKATKPTTNISVTTWRFSWLVAGVVALVLAYLMLLRAFDTGSLQQYGIVLITFIFSINRFVKAARGTDHGKD